MCNSRGDLEPHADTFERDITFYSRDFQRWPESWEHALCRSVATSGLRRSSALGDSDSGEADCDAMAIFLHVACMIKPSSISIDSSLEIFASK